MEESSEDIQEPPPELEEIIHNVRPILRIDQTPDNHEGRTFYIDTKDPYRESFMCAPEFQEEAKNLRFLQNIYFFHEYEREGKFTPKLYEIVERIPEKYKRRNLAVEVVLERDKISRVNGHYRAEAMIYETDSYHE